MQLFLELGGAGAPKDVVWVEGVSGSKGLRSFGIGVVRLARGGSGGRLEVECCSPEAKTFTQSSFETVSQNGFALDGVGGHPRSFRPG